jgi:hypothetical protein
MADYASIRHEKFNPLADRHVSDQSNIDINETVRPLDHKLLPYSIQKGTGLTLMPECRRRIVTLDYRSKCRCRTNFFPLIPAFTIAAEISYVFLLLVRSSRRILSCRQQQASP